MSNGILQYAATTTPRRSPAMYWMLGILDVLLGIFAILFVLAAMIAASCLILLTMWIAGFVTFALIPAVIVGSLRLSDRIVQMRRRLVG